MGVGAQPRGEPRAAWRGEGRRRKGLRIPGRARASLRPRSSARGAGSPGRPLAYPSCLIRQRRLPRRALAAPQGGTVTVALFQLLVFTGWGQRPVGTRQPPARPEGGRPCPRLGFSPVGAFWTSDLQDYAQKHVCAVVSHRLSGFCDGGGREEYRPHTGIEDVPGGVGVAQAQGRSRKTEGGVCGSWQLIPARARGGGGCRVGV